MTDSSHGDAARTMALLAASRRRIVRWVLAAVVAVVGSQPLGCESQGIDPATGGETHFLRMCDPQNAPCPEPLSCLCGVCTLPCAAQSACDEIPEAQCLSTAALHCEAAAPSKMCEVACASNDECLVVSADHQCVDGRCRQGSSDVTSDGLGGASGDTTSTDPSCSGLEATANEVLIIGDSFFATTHQITAYLENQARDAGVLDVGERYRDQSRLTMNALALNGEGIRAQYETASAETPARLVIMNGGGADILLGSCEPLDEGCPLIANAATALSELLLDMADDGVEAVIFLGYPLPQAPQPAGVGERLEILRPLLEGACQDAPVPCTWVDLRPIFADHYDEYIQSDGLNPTAVGAEHSAQALGEA
ncbi:MAG TPA: SGNH/GDSL hydrolase family protein, partial [Polyangiaceae bacterium]|nr:SGNH/GDSL hydrolase family protein [Polyangiaceae bacterium]